MNILTLKHQYQLGSTPYTNDNKTWDKFHIMTSVKDVIIENILMTISDGQSSEEGAKKTTLGVKNLFGTLQFFHFIKATHFFKSCPQANNNWQHKILCY